MNKLRQLSWLLIAAVLCMAWPAAAETTAPTDPAVTATADGLTQATTASAEAQTDYAHDKTYAVVERGASGAITSTPDTPALWEYPLLSAGTVSEGRFVLVNHAPRTVSLWLEALDLPYDDQAAMLYLAALHITVTRVDDGTVVYDGTYAGMVEDPGLSIRIDALASDEEQAYAVRLFCPFSYSGDPEAVSQMVEWRFAASADIEVDPETPPLARRLIAVLPWVLGGLIALGVILAVVRAIRRRRAD